MVRDAEYYVNYVNQWMEENKNKGYCRIFFIIS